MNAAPSNAVPSNAVPANAAAGTVRRAMLSVYDKTGLIALARALADMGVELIASGGTAAALQEAGVASRSVEAFTGAREVLGGRVKTLHPRVHAGILADRRRQQHLDDLRNNEYATIDLVVCNLYPFEQTLAAGKGRDQLIEKIDIGGPTLVRAAAKNVDGGVTVLTDPADYDAVVAAVRAGGAVPHALRKRLAAKAFRAVANYDLAIATWCETQTSDIATPGDADAEAPATADTTLPPRLGEFVRAQSLRYGENPHQRAALYIAEPETQGVARGRLLGGKELSYNNYLDMDAAYRAVYQIAAPGCAIVKHTNPCGLAQGTSQAQAFERALAGDPVAAFGSVIGFNETLSGDAAEAMRASKLFVECIVAPGFSEAALEIFKKRENLRLFIVPPGAAAPRYHAHRIGGGLLVQETDPGVADPSSWQNVTHKQPETGWLEQLAFAMNAVAVLKSNAIAITRDHSLLGAGAGQMSRVDACEQAIKKAGNKARGAFLASDAFFPFADCVQLAAAAGIVAIVQPGGSKRDQDSIDACNAAQICMVFSGRRHFRH